MNNLTLVNESKKVSSADFLVLVQAAKQYVPFVTKAWGLPDMNVKYSPTRIAGDWNVVIMDSLPNPALNKVATGYHEVVDNTPIAYVRSYTKFTFGGWYKGSIIKGVIKRLPKVSYDGVSTTLLHEIAEMIVDPFLTFKKQDSNKINWMVEVCDHSHYSFDLTVTLGGVTTDVIAPDFTLPAFYEVGAKAPYSYLNIPVAPFTLGVGCYGTGWDSSGKQIKLTKG
jgi:hypothetical protein